MEKYDIYIITCKNVEHDGFYLGSSNNIIQRMRLHKHNSKIAKGKLYEYIRSNGGWDEFKYEIIDTVHGTEKDAVKRETELFDLMHPSLNKNRPIRDPEITKIQCREGVKRFREKAKAMVRATTNAIVPTDLPGK